MDYKEIENWILNRLPFYQNNGSVAYKPGLDNINKFIKELNLSNNQLKFIHVGGTNGKGSTCSYISSILQESNFKVGTFTSPHYFDYRERIKINNHKIEKSYITSFILKKKPKKMIVVEKDQSLAENLKDIFSDQLTIINNDKFKGDKSQLSKNSISIGNELSFSLDLKIGDKITLMSPSGVETIIGSMPKQKTFEITSIFNSGLADFDNNIALINLDTLDDFFGFEKKDRNLEIYLKDPKNIEKQKQTVQKIFDQEFIYTWADMNSSLFSALKVERNVMFIILSLIIIVAAFNIISGLTILVKNKTRDIAILKSIGVLNKSIIKIFFLIGVIIGTSATIFGIILGVTFSIYIENFRQFLSSTFNISLFPEEIYFLSTMPSEINPSSILLISICSILITIIVSIFPAFKAANLDPIKALKYE